MSSSSFSSLLSFLIRTSRAKDSGHAITNAPSLLVSFILINSFAHEYTNFSFPQYFIPVGTGHMISLHYSAQQSFQRYHAFLAANGF